MAATIRTITEAERRAEEVRLWGEEKVAANEADVARRFAHLSHRQHATPNADCRRCTTQAAR
jgi:hypothetical protein